MRSFARRASVVTMATTMVALVVASPGVAGESHELVFKFEEGRRSSYAIDIELDIATTAERRGQKQESSARTKKLALSMDVVEHAAVEGVRASPELAVTFSDLVIEQELSGASGDITLEINGDDVLARRGRVTIVDTKNGKGKNLAVALLGEFAFIGKEGTITLGPSGSVTKVDGPPAFTSFMSTESGAGLWILETKPGAIAVGETWKSVERRIRSFRGLDLSTNPIAFTVSYTLEEFVERDERHVAKISVKSSLKRKRNLTATVTGESLKGAHVNIRKLERTAKGTIIFDIEEGRIIESDIEFTLDVEVEMKVKGERGREDERFITVVKGTGRATMKLQPPKAGEADDASDAASDAASEDEPEVEPAEAP